MQQQHRRSPVAPAAEPVALLDPLGPLIAFLPIISGNTGQCLEDNPMCEVITKKRVADQVFKKICHFA